MEYLSNNSFVLTLEELISEIKRITLGDTNTVSLSHEEFVSLDSHVKKVESLIFDHAQSDQHQILEAFSSHAISLLNHAYCLWETLLEKQFVKNLFLDSEISFSSYYLKHRFQRLISNELDMLNKANLKKVLFIGSGPFPVSALWIHKLQNIAVDCLDINAEAAQISRKVIDKLEHREHLNVIYNPNGDYDVSEYDAIFIALLAKPKQLILENIAKTMSSNCQVICRTSVGLRTLIYEPTELSEMEVVGFKVKDQRIINGQSSDTISSYLLERG